MSLFAVTWSVQVERLLPPVLRSKDFIESEDDFKVNYADNDYICYALLSSPGHWKEFPLKGIRIIKYLGGPFNILDIERAIRLDLQDDIFPSPMVNARSFPVITINSVTLEVKQ
jgi:hypothetical protein